ncbi:MAG: carboxypeptidase regulatory-like domain-containing protein [Bacteroidales bacterium]|nr:carboxypeptidase regulatory-like domain-containing protein [Bacteroidales bacterium]
MLLSRNILSLFYLLLISVYCCKAQYTDTCIDSLFISKTEVVFSFSENDASKINHLSNIISIDYWDGNTVRAYANQHELKQFLTYGYSLAIHDESQSKAQINMAHSISDFKKWDSYPTYPTYLEIMNHYANAFPSICKIDTIGTSVNGHLILCCKISDNVHSDEAEPEFFYSSTIHGNEVLGYQMMLRMIDTMLHGYTTDTTLQSLINTTEIYINPLANPDGTYNRNDTTVVGATRYNANFVDLNRNYPSEWSRWPIDVIQPENQQMIDYCQNHNFVMAANLHSGAEVLNYPWDSFRSSQRLHADDNWWIEVCQRFVNQARDSNPLAMSADFASGYTAGGDWYVIPNGRQDYMNYYNHTKELTIEISTDKLVPSYLLNHYWNTMYKPFIGYICEVHSGIHGIVTDSIGTPIAHATITVEGRDRDSSEVHTSPLGDFYRPIESGSYNIKVSAPGYKTLRIENVETLYPTPTVLNIQLERGLSNIAEHDYTTSLQAVAIPNPCHEKVTIKANDNIKTATILSSDGRKIMQYHNTQPSNTLRINTQNLTTGYYLIKITTSNDRTKILPLLKQ